MLNGAFKPIAILAVSCWLLMALACSSKKSPNSPIDLRGVSSEFLPVTWKGKFSDSQLSAWLQNRKDLIAKLKTTAPSNQLLVALGSCVACRSESAKILLERLLTTQGAMPQVFVPSVREAIRNDSKIKTLGNLGVLGNILKGAMASDNKLTKEIRTGISNKGKEAIASIDLMRDQPNFWFDGFTSLSAEHSDHSFHTMDMAAKWFYVASLPEMWEQKTPLLYGNHGAQLLAFVSVINDWNYLYGLQSDSTKRPYGGLAFDPRKGNTADIKAIDPRQDDSGPGIFSGRYRVTFDKSQRLVDVATKAQEKWQREVAPVTLEEQALVLLSGARAMQRFRPKSSAQFPGLFTDPGFFPKEAIMVPLIHLSGAKYLLDGKFIDKETREIFASAVLDGSALEEANLAAKMRLSQALVGWLHELESLEDLKQNAIYTIDANKVTELVEGRGKLELAAQAVLQSIVGQHLVIEKQKGVVTITVVVDKTGKKSEMREQLELVYTLFINQKLLSSPFIETRAITVLHAAAKSLAEGQVQLSSDLAALAWLGAAIEQTKLTLKASQIGSWPWFEQLSKIYAPQVTAANENEVKGP